MVLLKRFILILLSAGSFVSIFSSYKSLCQADKKITLPLLINETTLVLESIEESSSGAGAEAVIYNNSGQLLESFYIEVQTGTSSYIFESTMLPSFGRIILSERSHKSWHDQQIQEIRGYYKPFIQKQYELYNEYIVLQGQYLIINNLSNHVLDMTELYLKQWDADYNRFTSVKTDKIVIRNIQPGDELRIKLNDESLKIICICIKEPQHNLSCAAAE